MKLIRKFYMADPPGGAGAPPDSAPPVGPSDKDLSRAEKLSKLYKEMENDLRGIGINLLSKINDEIQDWDKNSQDVVKSIGTDLKNAVKESIKLTKDLADTQKGIGNKLSTELKVQQQITAVEERRKDTIAYMQELQSEGVTITAQIQEQHNNLLKTYDKQTEQLEKQLRKVQSIDGQIKGIGKILTGLSKIPIVGQLIAADKVFEKMKKTAEEGGSRMKVFGAGLGAFIDGIAGGLTGLIIPALKFIINSVLQFNQKAFDIAKNLGVTVDEAQKIQKTFTQIASTSENAALTGKDITETYIQLSSTMGFLVPQSKEFAETAALIQKRLGASAEDMQALALQSALSGKTLLQTMGTLNASRNIQGARNKLLLSEKQILSGIAKTSSAVLINFKGNVGALGDAIVRATKLGTTLDTVNKQGNSLLDFESSISKEFEAQILTGRNINLTKARELALNGKTVELMEELNKQGATYKQFMDENVIARDAEAAAIGLGTEEYAKILLQAQQAKKLGAEQGQTALERYNRLVKEGKTQADIIKMLGSEQEAADLKKASMQDKYNAAIEKLKDTLGSVLEGPVGKLIDKFTKFIGDQRKMNALAEKLKSIFDFIGDTIDKFPGILSSAISVMKVLVTLSIARAVASIVASLSAVPVLGAAAGVTAGIAAYSWLDGLMSGIGGTPPTIEAPAAAPETAVGLTKPTREAPNARVPQEIQSANSGTPVNSGHGKSMGNVYLDNHKVGHILFNNANQQQLNIV